jgi:hypothetical protein
MSTRIASGIVGCVGERRAAWVFFDTVLGKPVK